MVEFALELCVSRTDATAVGRNGVVEAAAS
jgi:hypothetical protein